MQAKNASVETLQTDVSCVDYFSADSLRYFYRLRLSRVANPLIQPHYMNPTTGLKCLGLWFRNIQMEIAWTQSVSLVL